MTATVTRIPVAMKRGRKVTTGPKATVTQIYGLVEEEGLTERTGPIGTYEEELAALNALMVKRRAQEVERQAQQEAWIDLSSNVRRWPENRRTRSEELVQILGRGGEDEEPEVKPEIAEARERFLRDMHARRDEIIADHARKQRAIGFDHRRVEMLVNAIEAALDANQPLFERQDYPMP